MIQVTDSQSLRKLNCRLSEVRFLEVKQFLEAVRSSPQNANYNRLSDFLSLPRVKENAHMTSILQEIKVLFESNGFDGAQAVAKRVLEVPITVSLGKPVQSR